MSTAAPRKTQLEGWRPGRDDKGHYFEKLGTQTRTPSFPKAEVARSAAVKLQQAMDTGQLGGGESSTAKLAFAEPTVTEVAPPKPDVDVVVGRLEFADTLLELYRVLSEFDLDALADDDDDDRFSAQEWLDVSDAIDVCENRLVANGLSRNSLSRLVKINQRLNTLNSDGRAVSASSTEEAMQLVAERAEMLGLNDEIEPGDPFETEATEQPAGEVRKTCYADPQIYVGMLEKADSLNKVEGIVSGYQLLRRPVSVYVAPESYSLIEEAVALARARFAGDGIDPTPYVPDEFASESAATLENHVAGEPLQATDAQGLEADSQTGANNIPQIIPQFPESGEPTVTITRDRPSPDTTMLDPGLIRTDGGTQARAALDEKTVADYAEAMLRGDIFPEVVVFYDGTDYWPGDGFHRLAATERAQLAEIAADVRQGTQRDAVLYAVGANARHGLRRTDADKRRAVETLLRDAEWSRWSNREIASAAGVSKGFVGDVREELTGVRAPDEVKASRGGREYTVKTSGNTTRDVARSSASDEVAIQATPADEDDGSLSAELADIPLEDRSKTFDNYVAAHKSEPAAHADEGAPHPGTEPDASDGSERWGPEWQQATVIVTLRMLPDDGHVDGRRVIIAAHDEGGTPLTKLTRAGALGLDAGPVHELMRRLSAEMPSRAAARKKPDARPATSTRTEAKKTTAKTAGKAAKKAAKKTSKKSASKSAVKKGATK
jgi:hypothetical protein